MAEAPGPQMAVRFGVDALAAEAIGEGGGFVEGGRIEWPDGETVSVLAGPVTGLGRA